MGAKEMGGAAPDQISVQGDHSGWDPAGTPEHEAKDHPAASTRLQACPRAGSSRAR